MRSNVVLPIVGKFNDLVVDDGTQQLQVLYRQSFVPQS